MTHPSPERPGQLLPIPAHRRRRIVPFMGIGILAVIVGIMLDNDFVWGLGVGLLASGVIAWALDRSARKRSPR